MKKLIILVFGSILISTALISINSCSTAKEFIANKSGAQLWAENCVRCHNNPNPTSYNNYQWDLVGLHMQVRANLTENETHKILEFLKTANN